jgi:Flp pilus assembly protein TadD
LIRTAVARYASAMKAFACLITAIIILFAITPVMGGPDRVPPGYRERKTEEEAVPSRAPSATEASAPAASPTPSSKRSSPETLRDSEEYAKLKTAEKEGQWKEMLEAAQNLVGRFPENAEAHACLGHANAYSGYLENAVAAFRVAIKIKADYPEAWYDLGLCYTQLLKEEDASAAYLQAVKLKPGFSEALVNLGNIYIHQGNMEEATKTFSQATKVKPDDAAAWGNLGICYSRQRKHAEAVAAYLQALKLKPDYSVARGSLVMAYRALGEIEKSKEALAELRRRDPLTAQKIESLLNTSSP